MRIARQAKDFKKREETKYIKEISADHVIEIITEIFDNALDLMSPYSWVYGGVIRDVLANLPLIGDLDITTTRHDEELYENFRGSTKWIEIDPTAKFDRKAPSGSRIAARTNPISNIFRFKNVSGRVVDIIFSSKNEGTPLESALYPARSVDLVCCGAVIDHTGKIYEVVPEALEDCKARILRFNPLCANTDEETLIQRVKMLEKRGWKSKVDFKKAMIVAKTNLRKAERLEEAKKSAVKVGMKNAKMSYRITTKPTMGTESVQTPLVQWKKGTRDIQAHLARAGVQPSDVAAFIMDLFSSQYKLDSKKVNITWIEIEGQVYDYAFAFNTSFPSVIYHGIAENLHRFLDGGINYKIKSSNRDGGYKTRSGIQMYFQSSDSSAKWQTATTITATPVRPDFESEGPSAVYYDEMTLGLDSTPSSKKATSAIPMATNQQKDLIHEYINNNPPHDDGIIVEALDLPPGIHINPSEMTRTQADAVLAYIELKRKDHSGRSSRDLRERAGSISGVKMKCEKLGIPISHAMHESLNDTSPSLKLTDLSFIGLNKMHRWLDNVEHSYKKTSKPMKVTAIPAKLKKRR